MVNIWRQAQTALRAKPHDKRHLKTLLRECAESGNTHVADLIQMGSSVTPTVAQLKQLAEHHLRKLQDGPSGTLDDLLSRMNVNTCISWLKQMREKAILEQDIGMHATAQLKIKELGFEFA